MKLPDDFMGWIWIAIFGGGAYWLFKHSHPVWGWIFSFLLGFQVWVMMTDAGKTWATKIRASVGQ